MNIGQEQDGKNDVFERPVLVLKKFYRGELLCAVPLTSSIKFGDYYVGLGTADTKASWALMPQLRALSRKRLIRKIRRVSYDEFDRVKQRLGLLLQK